MTNIILYTNYTYIFLNIFKLVKHIPMEVRRNGIHNSEGKPLWYPNWHEKWFSCSQTTGLWIIFFILTQGHFFFIAFREWRWEREISMGEGSTDQLPPVPAQTGDQICNPGKCPDWGPNLQTFDKGTVLQPTEHH